MYKKLRVIYLLTITMFASSFWLGLPAYASSTITVNSTADTTIDDGVCTFREAIIASNTDTASGASPGECIAGNGNDTINFNITGAADFVNSGQNGYTIKPNS